MASRTTRLLLPFALCTVVCACSAGGMPEDDGAEQEQAITAAQQAAQSAATPATEASADAPPPVPTCDASQVQGLVGKPADEATLGQARTDAGADQVRVIKPGTAVTMEFNGARLNVEVDADNRIVALRCG